MRAAVFSVVCVVLAALGHVVAGGSGPAPWAVVAGGLGVLAVAAGMAGRERSAAVISVSLAGAQLVLHELFAFGSPAEEDISLVLHLHGESAGLGESLGMLIAHMTATLLTGLWLARGEAALWATLRRLGASPVVRRLRAAVVRRLRRALALLWEAEGGAARPAWAVLDGRSPAFAPAEALLRHSVIRRGPPLPAA
ncbi:MFS transporter [Thermocatellispora tengchongensis]